MILGATSSVASNSKLSTVLISMHVEPEVVDDYPKMYEVDKKPFGLGIGIDDPAYKVKGQGQTRDGKPSDGLSPVGRLKRCFDHWQTTGACEAVLSVVSAGYKIPLKEPKVCSSNNKSSRDNPDFVQAEIKKLVLLGCVSETRLQPDVVNFLAVACRHDLNLFLHKFKFKYENACVARDMFAAGEFVFTFVLKSAYHHIEIFPDQI